MLNTNLSLLLPPTQFERFETDRLELCNQYARLRFGVETTDGRVPDTVLCADCRNSDEVDRRMELIKIELSVFIYGGLYVKNDTSSDNPPYPFIDTLDFGVYDQFNDCRSWFYSKDDAYQYIFNNAVPHLFDFDIEKYKPELEPEIEKYLLTGWNMEKVESEGNPEWVSDYAIRFPIEVVTTGEMVGHENDIPMVKIGTRPMDDFALVYFHYTKIN